MSVTVSEDDETGEIVTQTTQTFRGSDGSSRTIKTTERYKNGMKPWQLGNNKRFSLGETERGRSVGEAKLIKLHELQDVKDVNEDQEETDDHFIEASQSENLNENVVFKVTPTKKPKEMPNFSNTLSFLKPATEAVEKVIEDITLKDPKVIRELLAIDFSDLLRVFQQIFLKSQTIEDAYRTLFNGISEHGGKGFIAKYQNNDDAESKIVDKFIRSLSDEGRNVMEMLDSEKLNDLIREYVNNIGGETLRQNGKQKVIIDRILKVIKFYVNRN